MIKTSVNLTRIGIDTMSKVVSSAVELPHEDQPHETENSPKKNAISGLKANLLRQATFKHEEILLESSPRRTKIQKLRVPDLAFTSIGSNKTIELRTIHQPAVLFISHRENATEAAALNWQLVQPYIGRQTPFFTANIIILNEFPGFTHPMVKRELRKAYNDIINDYVKDRQLAENIVHLLPDWKASVLEGFHISQRRPVMASVILTPYGNVQRVIENNDPLAMIKHELDLLIR
jgi:hypothetical protein